MHILPVGDFSRIYELLEFENEFEELCQDGKRKLYENWLYRNLINLDKHFHTAIDGNHIEKLSDTDPPLFSIRRPHGKNGNPRVIFAYITKQGNIYNIYLLHAFEEKNTSDYRRAITISKNRLKQLKEEYENE